MLNLNDLKVKHGQLLNEAKTLITGKNVTSEHRSQFDKIVASADEIQQDINRLEQVAKFEAESRSTSKPPRSQPGEQQEATPERVENEKRAFSQWFKTGHVSEENRSYLRSSETRDLGAGAVTGSITGGAFMVPVSMYPSIIQAKKSYGAILASLDTLVTDHGNPLRLSLSNDTGNGLTVIGEAVAASETDPILTGVTSSCDFVTTGVVKVSLSLISQSGFDLEAFLTQNLYQRYYRGLSQLVTNGSTSGNVASFTASATAGVTTENPISIQYSELTSLFGALDASFVETSSFYMTSSTRAYLMSLTASASGLPVLQPDANGNPFSSIFGRPIVISQFSDQIAATKTPILFGSGVDSYLVREAGGLSVSVMREAFLPQGELGVIGFGLVGGVSKNAGVSPLVALKMATS
ncbi:phage major capsid protein [Edaphobacter sp. DSM 109919]|uniref:Phage major capsid protein n=1 Tax=Edaphobacter paludis TaxID=3035702 RepID=A0AAU7CVE7_9BACT